MFPRARVSRRCVLSRLCKYCLTLSQVVYCEYLSFPAEFLSSTLTLIICICYGWSHSRVVVTEIYLIYISFLPPVKCEHWHYLYQFCIYSECETFISYVVSLGILLLSF